MSKSFDAIDVVSSAVAHKIRHEHPEITMLLMRLKLSTAFNYMRSEQTKDIPTMFVEVEQAGNIKKEFIHICGEVVGGAKAFHQGAEVCEEICRTNKTSFSKYNFHEVVTSKLYELLLWAHTGAVLEKVDEEARKQNTREKVTALAFVIPLEEGHHPRATEIH